MNDQLDVDVRGRRAPADGAIEDINGGPGGERCDAFCGVLVTMGLSEESSDSDSGGHTVMFGQSS